MRRGLALLLAAGLFATSCFGTFKTTRAVWRFNQDVGGKWGQEAIFLAFLIIPVYEVVALVDMIVFNTGEFWSGETTRPVTAGLQDEKVVPLPDGTELRLVREGEDTIRVEHGDEVRWFHRTADGMEALDAQGAVLAKAQGKANGDIEVTGPAGARTYSAEEIALVGNSAVSMAAWAAEQVQERQQGRSAAAVE